jgi:hypothetical protein
MSEKDSKDCLLVTQGLDLSCTHYGCHCGCHLRFPNLSVTSCNIPNCGQLHYSGGAISPRELQVVVSIWGCPTSWESHGLCSGNSAGNGQLHHTPHVNPDNFLPPGCSQDGTPISKIQSNQVYFDFQALIVDDCRMMGPTPKKTDFMIFYPDFRSRFSRRFSSSKDPRARSLSRTVQGSSISYLTHAVVKIHTLYITSHHNPCNTLHMTLHDIT